MTSYQGIVIRGLHQGTSFGFPTANIRLLKELPIASGVYAVRLTIDNMSYIGMLYAGTRPTLGLSQQTIEINIFNFQQDIYGKIITFCIIQKIREEQKFSSIDELIKQLNYDKAVIEKLF